MKYSHRTPENNKDNSRWLQVYGNCVWIKSEITIKLALRIKWSELGSIGLLNEWIIKTTKKFWTFEVYLKVHPFIHLFFASDFLCHRLFLDWLILELWIYRSECWVIPFVYYFVWEKKTGFTCAIICVERWTCLFKCTPASDRIYMCV